MVRALFLLYGCRCVSCLAPEQQKRKEIGYELPEIEIFQVLENEVTRFLTSF